MLLDEISGHTVYAPAIKPGAIVVDLGANQGRFSTEMIRVYGASCYALEPNPAAYQHIASHPLLKLFPLAVSEHSGVRQFHAAANSESSALASTADQHNRRLLEVQATTLDDFLRQQGVKHIDVLKMDIEGAEIAVLASCPDQLLRGVGQLTIEFHDFNGVTPVADVLVTLHRLSKLGFFILRMSRSCHIDVLLINQNLCPIHPLSRVWMSLVVRNRRCLARGVSRALDWFFVRNAQRRASCGY